MAHFSIGIEEEYFLVDAQTKRVPPNVQPSFFDAAKAATENLQKSDHWHPAYAPRARQVATAPPAHAAAMTCGPAGPP